MDQIRNSNDRCCQFGQGLRQGVHGIRQLLDLRLTELVVGLEAITFPLRVEQCLHGRELFSNLALEGRISLPEQGTKSLEGHQRALDIGLEVPQVGT